MSTSAAVNLKPGIITRQRRPAGPCAFVIFGATGDLTRRLLFPALYHLAFAGLLSREFAIVGIARQELNEQDLRERMRRAVVEAAGPLEVDRYTLDWLISRLQYIRLDAADAAAYAQLRAVLEETDQTHRTEGNYLFYCATAPEFFVEIAENLHHAGLLAEKHGWWRRIIIEKPFGRDLASARELNRQLARCAAEPQIYRIDHYLGKETVQNLLVFRFANGIFEPIWNRRYVDHVQITVAESDGVGTRAGYYDHIGALRDMVPNHLFQLLTLSAMEPPSSFSSTALHNEQLKVLEAVAPLGLHGCEECVVKGQYGRGVIDGVPVPAYREEPGVGADSETETYVALKLAVDSWRWAGVPFYLRTGKRLTARRTEVVIQFRQAPLSLFRTASVDLPRANRLVANIQPEEGLVLEFAAKAPGPEITAAPVAMRFCYRDYFGREIRTGYETLLYDAMIGDATLFARSDVIEAGWSVVDPVLGAWQLGHERLEPYPAGSDGPQGAHELLRRDSREWRPLA